MLLLVSGGRQRPQGAQGTQAWVPVSRCLEGPEAQRKQVAGAGGRRYRRGGVRGETSGATLGLGEPSPREKAEAPTVGGAGERVSTEGGHGSRRWRGEQKQSATREGSDARRAPASWVPAGRWQGAVTHGAQVPQTWPASCCRPLFRCRRGEKGASNSLAGGNTRASGNLKALRAPPCVSLSGGKC